MICMRTCANLAMARALARSGGFSRRCKSAAPKSVSSPSFALRLAFPSFQFTSPDVHKAIACYNREMIPPAAEFRTADAATVVENLAQVRARMAQAALRAGRNPADVTLVAVSKTHPLAAIAAVRAAGQHEFGENRLEELWEKVRAAQAEGIDGLRWHMIGPIQSRRSSQAIGPFGSFALVHAVDRLKIAQRLSRDAEAASCVLSVLLEVNVSGEASKHGFAPEELRRELAALRALPGLQIEGLMTMAPREDDPEAARPVFRSLRLLRDELVRTHGLSLPQLSMGMSGDFEVAIEEGATLVRVGSAIFGARVQ